MPYPLRPAIPPIDGQESFSNYYTIMMTTSFEPHYQLWSALPLFDRVSSPDNTGYNVPGIDDYDQPMFETDVFSSVVYHDFSNYPLATVDAGKYSQPKSLVCFKSGLVTPPMEPQITTSCDLIDAIPRDLITVPDFTRPSKCPIPNCKSTTVFDSGRDFRRHYRQHFKRFFCRYSECPQSTQDLQDLGSKGFATRKDRARHESKHKPTIQCPWRDRNGRQCLRVFSRVDNMRDHHRRIHKS